MRNGDPGRCVLRDMSGLFFSPKAASLVSVCFDTKSMARVGHISENADVYILFTARGPGARVRERLFTSS